ncbi:MAG: HNH endonuclease [Candidatus ainarchaeum sp.]|nr:HNH endonuclease [Candidatus ainarchaeum sp.]
MITEIIKHKKDIVQDGVLKRKAHGYLFVKVGIGWIPEHVLVMEEKIRRTLNKGETIHHINGIKTDNRIENLMLFKSQKEHAKFHNKIRQFGMTQPIIKQINERFKEYERD